MRPVWLRPTALLVIATLHAGALLILDWPADPTGAALPPIEVQIVPQGEPAREAVPLGAEVASEASSAASEARPLEPSEVPDLVQAPAAAESEPPPPVADITPPQHQPDEPPSQSEATRLSKQDTERSPPPALTAELPVREAPDAQTLPAAPPRERVPVPPRPVERRAISPKPLRPEPTQVQREEQRRATQAGRREALRREQIEERRREEAEEARDRARERAAARAMEAERARRAAASAQREAARRAASSEQAASRVGSTSGGGGTSTASSGAISSAAYGALVAAELNRHKRYPEAARAQGAQGVVVVSFVIGPSGRVASHTIARSSGVAVLDSAVSQMMAAVHLPPPPGGSFRATAPVRFNLLH